MNCKIEMAIEIKKKRSLTHLATADHDYAICGVLKTASQITSTYNKSLLRHST